MESSNFNQIGIYDDCFNPYVLNEVPDNSVCLDLGCWTGNLGQVLKDKKKCVVDGVDHRNDVLERAKERGYRAVYNIDLNCKPESLTALGKYDCIICADILEHLTNPKSILKYLKDLLPEGGIIVASVPNIAFIQQRVLLLSGRFDYNPTGGIMDESHLRFFTKKSLANMFKEAGYTIETLYGYSLVKERYFFLRRLSSVWPDMFALQFLIKVNR